jgi:uncharacterized protein (DUF58 family)
VSPRSHVFDPTRTATVREYQPDDPQRLIHWASTARRGSLQVRVLEPATSLHVSLVLDVRGFTFGPYRDELLELALSALASMAIFLQGQDAPVGLLANTPVPLLIPRGATVLHLQALLEGLARLTPSADLPLVPWLFEHLPPGDTVVLVTSDVAPNLEGTIARLRERSVSPLLVVATTSDARIKVDALRILPGCDLAAVLEGRA